MMQLREASHSAIAKSESSISQYIRKMAADSMKSQLCDKPELWDKLIPNYSPGCKRVIPSDDYYVALNQKHVDLETRPIKRVTELGIETADGDLQEYDFIIAATGFRTVEFMHPIQVYGINGRPVSEIWKNGATAYYGVTVEDLPNFGMLYGPNTNLGE
jgi:cation diffusion facilitator CzcD-associated flavoprotein CzcO